MAIMNPESFRQTLVDVGEIFKKKNLVHQKKIFKHCNNLQRGEKGIVAQSRPFLTPATVH